MSKKKKIDTRDFLNKVKKLAKDRMSEGKVVPLDPFRSLERQAPSRILIIEDDETIRAALKRTFLIDGFEVVTVADGTHLTQVLDDSPINLVVMDIGLPWINGFELAKLIKEDRDLKEIPLIFVSGCASDLDVRKGFELGAVDYIKKPFDVKKIRKTVRVLLQLNK